MSIHVVTAVVCFFAFLLEQPTWAVASIITRCGGSIGTAFFFPSPLIEKEK